VDEYTDRESAFASLTSLTCLRSSFKIATDRSNLFLLLFFSHQKSKKSLKFPKFSYFFLVKICFSMEARQYFLKLLSLEHPLLHNFMGGQKLSTYISLSTIIDPYFYKREECYFILHSNMSVNTTSMSHITPMYLLMYCMYLCM
jgi:hypothetical protein